MKQSDELALRTPRLHPATGHRAPNARTLSPPTWRRAGNQDSVSLACQKQQAYGTCPRVLEPAPVLPAALLRDGAALRTPATSAVHREHLP